MRTGEDRTEWLEDDLRAAVRDIGYGELGVALGLGSLALLFGGDVRRALVILALAQVLLGILFLSGVPANLFLNTPEFAPGRELTARWRVENVRAMGLTMTHIGLVAGCVLLAGDVVQEEFDVSDALIRWSAITLSVLAVAAVIWWDLIAGQRRLQARYRP